MTKRIENKGTLKRVFGVLVVLLVACLAFTMPASALDEWDGSITDVSTWYKEDETSFTISTAEQLAGLAQSNEKFIGKTIVLGDDIDLKDIQWTPFSWIGGTFDGNGKTIKNLNVTTTDGHGGFIAGAMGSVTPVIKDLTIENATVSDTGDCGSAGVLFGQLEAVPVVIERCNVTGDIQVSAQTFAGGLIGYTNAGVTIKDCLVIGTTGSLVTTTSALYDGGAGGLVGFHGNSAGSITGCTVDIAVSGQEQVGGLIGRVVECQTDAVISGCTATGSVTLNAGATGKNVAVGGLIGDVVDTNYAKIEDCDFTGSITVDSTVPADKVTTGLVGAETGGNALNQKVSDSTITLTPESAENLVSYYKNNNVDVNDKIVGDVSVKDSNNNVVLVTGLDQTIVADDGTTSTITWDNGAVSITGAETNADGEILVGGTPVVKTDDTPLTSTDSTINVNVGSGTADDPYLIANEAQLRQLATDVNNGETKVQNKHFKLTADIPLTSDWIPIGTATYPFLGTFDGDNKTISNLKVTGSSDYVGLFGYAWNAENTVIIKNVVLKNVEISGNNRVGSLVGNIASHPSGFIENCHVSGVIKVSGNSFVGGLVGYSYISITGCTVEGDDGSKVTGTGESVGGLSGLLGENLHPVTKCDADIPVTGARVVGGLIGSVNQGADITESSSSGTVTITYDSAHQYADYEKSVGALAGRVGTDVEITSSSSTSDVVVDTEFKANSVDISAGFVGLVIDHANNAVNGDAAVNTVTVTTSTWTPSDATYEALKDAGYLQLEEKSDSFKVADPVSPPVQQQPSSSSSSSGSSVWLQEPATPTPTPTPTETVTPTDAVPTDIPVTQPTEEPSSPGFGVLAVLAGLGAVAVLRRK